MIPEASGAVTGRRCKETIDSAEDTSLGRIGGRGLDVQVSNQGLRVASGQDFGDRPHDSTVLAKGFKVEAQSLDGFAGGDQGTERLGLKVDCLGNQQALASDPVCEPGGPQFFVL